MRSAHTADVELTFNAFADPEAWNEYSFVDFDNAPEFAARWVAMLARFAREGNPSGPLGEWPAYHEEQRLGLLVTPDGGTVLAERDGAHRRVVWAEA